ncbi:MAG: sterol desaturase family protein [Gammaproteobacteria bacterium]
MFALMALWEVFAPRRALTVSKAVRWLNNLSLVALNTVLLRLLFPAAAAGMAAFAAGQQWGLLNHFQVPLWLAVVVTVIAMDFVIWLQHVMVHAVPALWRFHRVHHADLDYDLTTGARFHPLEIILSMLIKFATILVLGPPVVAVILFEVILNGMALFNHANVRLPLRLDRALRWLLVTPDMHRVHHSVADDETNSNFGFNLSWWDRLLGTYRDQPRGGHQGMTIGIRDYRKPREVSWLPGLLTLPFRGRVTGYAINRRQWRAGEEGKYV